MGGKIVFGFILLIACWHCQKPDEDMAMELTLSGIVSDVTIFGGGNGFIDLSITGGSQPYNIMWSTGECTEDIDSLCAGTYIVQVSDAGNRQATDTFVVAQPEPAALRLAASVTDVDRYGGANGSIRLTVTGGVPPYIYTWSTGETTADVANLVAGVYIVSVKDVRQELVSDTFEITQPSPDAVVIDYSVSHPSATGCSDGVIDLTISGGYPPFTCLWSTGSTNEDPNNLGAGIYHVKVTDSEDQVGMADIVLSDSLKDIDGNAYSIVKIGGQYWMGENLKVTHAPDGTPVTGYAFGDNESKVSVYGRLYTWDVAMNGSVVEEAQGICPIGWHVPSDEEFKVVEMHLGMTRAQADEVNTWRGTGVGTSLIYGGASGYDAMLSGRRIPGGAYSLLGTMEYMWTSTEYAGSYAWRRCLDIDSDLVGRWNTFQKSYGFSVRCVRDN